MNIFYLDNDPTLAAQAQCDKHVVKMILESAQLLCTTHHYFDSDPRPETHKHIKFYKKTHVNHPCSIWTRKSLANYNWLAQHALALCSEYTYRYNKQHKSYDIIVLCSLFYPTDIDVNMWLTEPALAMPDEYKSEDPVESYRRYYKECKRNTIQMRWTKREPPKWWNTNEKAIVA